MIQKMKQNYILMIFLVDEAYSQLNLDEDKDKKPNASSE